MSENGTYRIVRVCRTDVIYDGQEGEAWQLESFIEILLIVEIFFDCEFFVLKGVYVMHNISVLGLFAVSFIDPDGFRYIDVFDDDNFYIIDDMTDIDIFH